MLPVPIIKLLSLDEWKERPAITMEIEFNDYWEIIWEMSVYRSYFQNQKGFNKKTFKQNFFGYWAPFHDDLHELIKLAKLLRFKRIWEEQKWWTQFIPVQEIMISEIVHVVNSQMAQIAKRNQIPITYAHRINWDFRYSNKDDRDAPFTRITCPWRRAIDMVILWQILEFFESNWSSLLFDEQLFSDLTRYNNTRSPYLQWVGNIEESRAIMIQRERRTKRFQSSPDQLSDEDIQYFFSEWQRALNQAMIDEVEQRIEKWPISNATLVYILFSWAPITQGIMKKIYTKLKNEDTFWFFFNILKRIKNISISITKHEDDKTKSELRLEINWKVYVKDFKTPLATESKYKNKVEAANNKKYKKDLQNFIMQTYITQLYADA